MAGLYPECTLMVLGVMVTLHTAAAHTNVMLNCTTLNAFSCRTDSGLVIDLSPLDSGDYLRPAFYDVSVAGISQDKFSWNPVTPFCENHCEGVAMCQVQSGSSGLYYPAGLHSTAAFHLNYSFGNIHEPGLSIVYTATTNLVMNMRRSIVRLFCDENGSEDRLIPFGETSFGSAIYVFNLVSKFACPRKIPLSTPTILQSNLTCPQTTKTTIPSTTRHHSTTPRSTTEFPSRSTTEFPTRSPTAAGVPVRYLERLMWIAVAIISSLLLMMLVFVVVLIVRLGNKSQPTIVLPSYHDNPPLTDDARKVKY